MAITYTRQGDTDSYQLVSLYCDTKADIANLPTDVLPGSDCICREGAVVLLFGSDGKWEEI